MQVPQIPTTQTTVSRRKLLTGGATLAVGGGALAMLGSRRAAAQVSLNVPDASHSGQDGTVTDILVSIDGTYQYSVPEASTLELTLSVSPPDADDFQAIASTDHQPSGIEGVSEFGLSGSVLDHDGFDAAAFSADAGTTVTQSLQVRVGFAVVSDGDTVASDHATTDTTVTVENTSVATEVSISADGTIDIQV